jgi:hypothetical protein
MRPSVALEGVVTRPSTPEGSDEDPGALPGLSQTAVRTGWSLRCSSREHRVAETGSRVPRSVPGAKRSGIAGIFDCAGSKIPRLLRGSQRLASISLPIVTSPATYSNRQPSDLRERRVGRTLRSLDFFRCRVGSSQREVGSLVLPLAIRMYARLRHSLKQDRA